MEQIKKFLHGKGFALLLTASLLAAAAAGVWAVRALRAELQKSLDGLNAPGTTQQTTPETEPDWDAQEDTTWQQPVTDVANSKADVPQQTPSGASSGAQSGSGSLREPSALQGASSPASSSAQPAAAPSMPGRVLNAFSGDELVYNKTLGDWRTHNGVDYACTHRGGAGRCCRPLLAAVRRGRPCRKGRGHRDRRAEAWHGGHCRLRVRRGEPHPCGGKAGRKLSRPGKAAGVSKP